MSATSVSCRFNTCIDAKNKSPLQLTVQYITNYWYTLSLLVAIATSRLKPDQSMCEQCTRPCIVELDQYPRQELMNVVLWRSHTQRLLKTLLRFLDISSISRVQAVRGWDPVPAGSESNWVIWNSHTPTDYSQLIPVPLLWTRPFKWSVLLRLRSISSDSWRNTTPVPPNSPCGFLTHRGLFSV